MREMICNVFNFAINLMHAHCVGDQIKHCRSCHPFISTAQRKCQTFTVPMVVAIKEHRIVS